MTVRSLTAIAAALAALIVPAAAHAAVGATTVTQPANGTLFTVGDDPVNITVAGTAPGAADGDKVDLWCLRFTESDFVMTSDVTISGEAFSTNVPDSDFPAGTCRLLALPDNTPRPDTPPADQTGPLVTPEYRQTFKTEAPGAAEPGILTDFFLSHQQTRGYGDYDSISSCGLSDAKLFFADTGQSSNFVHYCNGWLDNEEDAPLNRAGARVDGHNAWGSSVDNMDIDPGAGFKRADTLQGVPPLTFSVVGGGRNEDMEILEEEDLVRCQNGDPFPVTEAGCGRFIPSGVRVFRRITQTRDGLLFLISDRFRSMDGAAHELDLHWFQAFRDPGNAAEEPGFQFPWISDAYATHNDGDTVPGTQAFPATMYVKSNNTKPDGDQLWPQGLVMFDRPVGQLRFVDDDDFLVPTTATVPAGGEVTIRHAYAIGTTRTALVDLAAEVEDRWIAPSVEITSPTEGATVTTAEIDVTGRATDNKSTPTLTLNGTAVPIGAGGAWTQRVTLQPGPNTLTAVVRDARGNEATTTRRVTYTAALPPDTLAPTFETASLSRLRFAVGPGATALTAAAKRGTQVRYSLSEPATVTFPIYRRKRGRRVGGTCRKITRANRNRSSCFRYKKKGLTISRSSPAGPSTLRFSGRIGSKALKRGRYRMELVATDAAGNRSQPRRLPFRIVRR